MRVTISMLKNRVAFLNKKMKRAETYFSEVDGKRKINVGHFTIDGAYGGYVLHEICNESGGCNDVFNIGHIPARDLLNLIYAFEAGMRYAEESK